MTARVLPACRYSARGSNDRRSPRQASWTASHAPQATTAAYGSSQSSVPAQPAPVVASLRRSSSSDATSHGRAARIAAENEASAGSDDRPTICGKPGDDAPHCLRRVVTANWDVLACVIRQASADCTAVGHCKLAVAWPWTDARHRNRAAQLWMDIHALLHVG